MWERTADTESHAFYYPISFTKMHRHKGFASLPSRHIMLMRLKLLLALLLAATFPAMAAVTFSSGGVDYELVNSAYSSVESKDQAVYALVCGAPGKPYLSIPETVTYVARSFTVVGVRAGAFQSSSSILEIQLPRSVRFIGQYAFCSSSLTKIHLPNSLQTIEESAFQSSRLKEVTLPDSLLSIGTSAFCGTKITSIKIPQKINRIQEATFANCLSLKEVAFAEESELIQIGSSAFSNCSLLRDISIPSSVYKLGTDCFSECGSLESIELSPKIQIIPENCFKNCVNLQGIDFPKSLRAIGRKAFYNCKSLQSVAIPENAEEIYLWAFRGCSNLSEIFIPRGLSFENQGSYADNAFTGCKINKVYLNSFPSRYNTVSYISSLFHFSNTTDFKVYVPVGMRYQYDYDSHFVEQNLSINLTKKSMVVGNPAKLTYTTAPVKLPLVNAMVWRSSNPGVATVDANGVVTPIAPGKTVISVATSCDGVELSSSAVVTVTAAPNTHFSIAEASAPVGQLMEIPIIMTNEESITSFQCDIALPDGFEADMTNEGLNLVLSARKRSTHVIEGAVLPDGKVRVVGYSTRNSTFSGNDGILFTLGVRAVNAAPGSHQVDIDEIYCVDNGGNELVINPASGFVTVEPAVGNGDANGDGAVNVSDVAITVGHILGEQNEAFVAANADVNGDNRINITDVTAIVTKILAPATATSMRVAPAAAEAEESLSVKNFSIAAGQTKRMPVYLNSTTNYSSFQTDIYLPEGLTPVMIDEDGDIFPDVELEATRRTSSHIIASAVQADGALRVLAYSTKNSLFRTGNEDTPLFYVNVTASADFTQQPSTVYFKETIFNTGKVESRFADSSSEINATSTGLEVGTAHSLKVWADTQLHVDASEVCLLPVAMLDGRTFVLEVAAGHNSFSLTPGVYIAAGKKLVVR